MNPIYEKLDFYARKAKEEGYFARSIYKLEEIDQKFALFKKGMKVVDLGCAPGSWCQYLSKAVGNNGLIVGIDYKKILCSSPNIILVHGNFKREENKQKIAAHAPFDAVVSDMAPDTSGDRLTDCYHSSDLVRDALSFSYSYLRKGGFFIAKIFQGGDEKEIMEELKLSFEACRCLKPKASRKNSFETFLIATGFKGKSDRRNQTEEMICDHYESGDMPW